MSGEICLSRIAAASPAGPAPTITTSNSIASRAGNSSVLIGSLKISVWSGQDTAFLSNRYANCNCSL